MSSQRQLTTFSVIIIKCSDKEQSYRLGNPSFIRSSASLMPSQQEDNMESCLFYVQLKDSNRDFKTNVDFAQEVMFRHKISNRYLGFSEEFEQQENDTTYRLQLTDKKCLFQTKISNNVKFNEAIYLAAEINGTKMGYVSAGTADQLGLRKTMVALNSKTKLELHSYNELEKDKDDYLFGQAIWLAHIESKTFLTYQHSEKQKEREAAIFHQMSLEALQSIDGLWLIESVHSEVGGKLQFGEVFRLKNLSTSRYLAFSKSFKEVNRERIHDIFLDSQPSEQSKFVFESLKEEESRIKKGSYLKMRHYESHLYIGTRSNRLRDELEYSSLQTFSEFQGEDLFDLIEVGQVEQQCIRFIFSIRKELLYMHSQLQKKELSEQVILQFKELYSNIAKQLDKIRKGSRLIEHVQLQARNCIQDLCMHIKDYQERQTTEKGTRRERLIRELQRLAYEILCGICAGNSGNQVTLFKSLPLFLEDLFRGNGAEELLMEIFRGNYSLQWKVPHQLPELGNRNIVKAVLQAAQKKSANKEQGYWANLLKVMQLWQVMLHASDSPIDVNQQLISSELFEQGVFDRVVFQLRVNQQRIRIKHHETDKFVEIELIRKPQLIRVVEESFHLFSVLCCNRNFIAKSYIHQYLNLHNRDGVEVIINYLNIPLSGTLSNYLFSLITNLYVDSCPRINRHKPLFVINFVFKKGEEELSGKENSRVSNEEAELSTRLRENLLSRIQSNYLSCPLNISNILVGTLNLQPTLSHEELTMYKDELQERIEANQWSSEMLKSISILIQLESYDMGEIIAISRLLHGKIRDNQLPNQITQGTMDIFNHILSLCHQLQLKKLTVYLKGKFRSSNPQDIVEDDIQYVLPLSRPLSGLKIRFRKSFQEFNEVRYTLSMLYPDDASKLELLRMFTKETKTSKLSDLRAIFQLLCKFSLPKLHFLQLLRHSMIITNEEAPLFEGVFDLYKKLKHLASISEHWLCSVKVSDQNTKSYFATIRELTNYLFQGYSLHSGDSSIRQRSAVDKNHQLLSNNIGVHEIIFSLLGSNFYLLQGKTRKQLLDKHREVFQTAFEFLVAFCKDCPRNISVAHENMHILNLFVDFAEVGQTRLSFLLFQDQKDLIQQVCPSMIERIIGRIVKNPRVRNNDGCEFNPELLEMLLCLLSIHGKIYKPNVEILYKCLQKESVFNKLFFVEQRNGTVSMSLQLSKISRDPLQMPYLYHTLLFRIINLVIECLQVQSNMLKTRIKTLFPISYLFQLLARPDIYTHHGVQAALSYLLKREILKMITTYQQTRETLSRLHSNESLSALVRFYWQIFVVKQAPRTQQSKYDNFYEPYLLRYNAELESARHNQRDHFLIDVNPFLLRILAVFIKMPGKELNKIYVSIQELINAIHVQNLSQDPFRKQMVLGITQIRLKWKNFVAESDSNNAAEKYAKKAVLQILRHPRTYEAISQQKNRFHQLLAGMEQEFLKALVMLIKMSTEAERSYEELQEKINSVHGLLKALAEYLLSRDDSKVMKGMKMMAGEKGDKEDGRKDKEKTKRDEGRKEAQKTPEDTEQQEKTVNETERAANDTEKLEEEKAMRQEDSEEWIREQGGGKQGRMAALTLFEHGILQILIDYTTSDEFDCKNLQVRRSLFEILRVLNFLIRNDVNNTILKTFYRICREKASSFRFFNCLNEAVETMLERAIGDSFVDHLNSALGSLQLCVQQRSQDLDKEALRFLGQLCNYPPFTDYLRYQTVAPSIDFLEKIYNSLQFLLYKHNTSPTLSLPVVDISESILEFVLCMLTGCDKSNQLYLIDNKFPEMVVDFMKMYQIKDLRNKANMAKRDRLLEEVIIYYGSNGIEVGDTLRKHIRLIDFDHLYLINRLKYTMLRVLLESSIANEQVVAKLKIKIPIQFLKVNLIWVYQQFVEKRHEYTEEPWEQVVDQPELDGMFLLIGFYYYVLIELQGAVEKEGGDDGLEVINDDEKAKQKVVKKFFSSISDGQRKSDSMKSLQNQPYGQEMKMFYEKYYLAYEFFQAKTVTIEANIHGCLTKLYFPKLPLCDRITEDIKKQFLAQAERISQEEKIKSLLQFQDKLFKQLEGEADFDERLTQQCPWLHKVIKVVQEEETIFMVSWIIGTLLTIFYNLENYVNYRSNFEFLQTGFSYIPLSDFFSWVILTLTLANVGLATLLLLDVLFRKIPFKLQLLEDEYTESEEYKKGGWNNSYCMYTMKLLFQEVSYHLFTVFFCYASVFHSMFSGFLVIYITFRIALGRQIFRSIRETWFNLFVAIGLLVVFNYFSSTFFYTLFSDAPDYGPICTNLYRCFLLLVDQSLKSGQGFIGTVTQSDSYSYISVGPRFVFELTYILFAQKVLFEIFSGTIIDKFSQLRQEGEKQEQDQESLCFICGQDRFSIDFELQGFEQHVSKTHNKMHYLYYMFYIRKRNSIEQGIAEKYVEECMLKNRKDWIPDGESILMNLKMKEATLSGEEQEKDLEEQFELITRQKAQQAKKLKFRIESLVRDLREGKDDQ